jgi:hypothetical protein
MKKFNESQIFKTVEKLKKIHTKKVINKNVAEKCTFFTFTHVRQICFGVF